MITLYSGTPGTGKSLDAAKKIREEISTGHPVIANFPINIEKVKQPKRNKTKAGGFFFYWDNSEMTVERLVEFARMNHKARRESQTLIVIDECSVLFNSRDWQGAGKERMKWIEFFQQHRKLGFDVLLIAQDMRMIDKQIRAFIEYNEVHRKINNYLKFGIGDVMDIMKLKMFVSVCMWTGGQGGKLSARYFWYSPRDAALYDTMAIFDRLGAPAAVQSAQLEPVGAPEGCPAGGVPSAPAEVPASRPAQRRSFKLEIKPKKEKIAKTGTRGRSGILAGR